MILNAKKYTDDANLKFKAKLYGDKYNTKYTKVNLVVYPV